MTTLIRHAVTTVVAAFAVAFGSPLAPAGPHRNLFAVVEGGPLHRNGAAEMANAGVTSYRFYLAWSQAQPARGTFDWSRGDEIVGNLAAGGITALPFLYATPSWLASSPQSQPLNGKKKRAWQSFLKAAVSRYGRGGRYWTGGATSPFHRQCTCNSKPKPVRAWQIWNEPNFKNYWQGKPSPRGYARLVKISHRAISIVDKRAKIVLAGLVGYVRNTGWSFLNRMYGVRGIKRAFDATALHPYARNVTQLRIEIRKFRAVQKRRHDARTPLWLTEHGWGSGPHRLSELNKGPRGQKRFLKRSFTLILQNRKRWNVGRLFWFSWRDGGSYTTGSCDFCKSAGLLNSDGSPKPAYYAYKRFAK